VSIFELTRKRFSARARRRVETGPPVRFRISCPPTRYAPSQARGLVARACDAWQLTAIRGDAELVVSELCGNATRHAGTSMDVVVHRTGNHLYVEVHDRSSELPVARRPQAVEDSGRGLILVDALAATWGSARTATGKVVWAALRLPMEGGGLSVDR
jgi:hypothetical protein